MATVKDPVCGMAIDPKTAAGQEADQGTTDDFCSTACRDTFKAAPQRSGR